MSVSLNRIAELEAPVTTSLTATTATAVYTAGGYFATVEVIILANVDASNACTCLLQWNDGTNDNTFYNVSVPAGDTVVIDRVPISKARDDGPVRSIKATAGAANDLVVTVITSAQSRNASGAG